MNGIGDFVFENELIWYGLCDGLSGFVIVDASFDDLLMVKGRKFVSFIV